MRITNQMSTNKMLLNINRNARKVDQMYTQIATGKKIQLPSDNPIVASRALKFRTSISETEQYKRNADQATSWMSVTEGGFINLLDLMETIRTRLVQGATDTLDPSDRDKIVTEISSFAAQIGGEMNVSYTGRYVFSGFRTNEPPVIVSDAPNQSYAITQMIYAADIQETKAYVKDSGTAVPEIYTINKIDLPYRSEDGRTVTLAGSPTPSFFGFPVTVFSDPADANYSDRYQPGAGDVHYIPETGELILGDDVVAAMRQNGGAGMAIDYTVSGLKQGDLNPIVYFDCTDMGERPVLSANAALFASGETMTIQYNANVYGMADDKNNIGDDQFYYDFATGELTLGTNLANIAASDPTALSAMTLYGSGGNSSAITPVGGGGGGKSYTMDSQQLYFEVGVNTRIQINSLAKDSYTPALYAELMNFIEMVGSVSISSEAELYEYYRGLYQADYGNLPSDEFEQMVKDQVERQLSDETKRFTDFLQGSFDAMLGRFDGHTGVVLTESTTLGSRMNRIDLTSNRLEQNRVSYTTLMSENENIDYLEVIMNMTAMESVYSASMSAGMRISQMTLADYIR